MDTEENITQIPTKKTYLDKSIIYAFKEPVNIEKSRFSLQLTGISVADQIALNEILQKLDNRIKLTDKSYIDSKKIIFNKCQIIVEIHGYRLIGTNVKPIWELKKAERCMGQNSLTTDNVLNIDVSTGKPVDYYQFKMYFLLRQISYKFKEPVKLKRSPFNVQILDISTSDKTIINNLLKRFDPDLQIDDSPFITENDMDETNYDAENKFFITVQFKGYKKSDRVTSPIWKIKSIQNVFN